MPQEIRAAFVAIGGLGVTALFTVLGFRSLVPMILESRFTGATFVAAVLAILLVLAIGFFTTAWVSLATRLMRPDQPQQTEKGDTQ